MAFETDPNLVLDAVERITAAPTPEDLLAEFKRFGRRAGFATIAIGELPRPAVPFEQLFFRSNWPDWWYGVYADEGLAGRDACVDYARQGVTPATWSELGQDQAEDAHLWRALHLASDHGWKQGIAIPIHGVGYRGVTVIAGETRDLPLRTRTALQLLGIAAHERMKELLAPERTLPVREMPRLSPGEADCIAWLMMGKSDWEIGEILGIAESTAHWRIEQAKKKFGVKTRAQLTALAVHHGYVTP